MAPFHYVDVKRDQFGGRFIAWKMPSVFDHFSHLHMQALDGVGRVDHFAYLVVSGFLVQVHVVRPSRQSLRHLEQKTAGIQST